jgi:hypothetical protein
VGHNNSGGYISTHIRTHRRWNTATTAPMSCNSVGKKKKQGNFFSCLSTPEMAQVTRQSNPIPSLLSSPLSCLRCFQHRLDCYPSHSGTPTSSDGSDDTLHDGAHNSIGFLSKLSNTDRFRRMSMHELIPWLLLPFLGCALSPQRSAFEHPRPPITSTLAPRMFPVTRNHLALPPSS